MPSYSREDQHSVAHGVVDCRIGPSAHPGACRRGSAGDHAGVPARDSTQVSLPVGRRSHQRPHPVAHGVVDRAVVVAPGRRPVPVGTSASRSRFRERQRPDVIEVGPSLYRTPEDHHAVAHRVVGSHCGFPGARRWPEGDSGRPRRGTASDSASSRSPQPGRPFPRRPPCDRVLVVDRAVFAARGRCDAVRREPGPDRCTLSDSAQTSPR